MTSGQDRHPIGHYAHVLAPIDCSGLSRTVLRRALEEARRHAARLTVLHVIEYYPTDVPVEYLVPPENANPVDTYMARAREHVKRLVEEAGCGDAGQIVVTGTSAAYHEIVQYAEGTDVDLIVMGYHGRWVTGALGSTAMAVTRRVLCDVLLVRDAGSGD